MSQQLDAQGEAHNALGTAVSSYGQRVLNDPHILGNLVTDLLPDLPRERSLLVTGADAGIAAQMTQHVEEQHIDPDTAVQLVARALSERRAIDQAASMWVATEYAQALGYRVRPLAEADQSTQPQVIAAATATMTAPGGPAMPSAPPAHAPGAQAPHWQTADSPPGQSGVQAPPAQTWPPRAQAAQAPPAQSWPPGAQAAQAPPGQSWPPAQPPGQSWPPGAQAPPGQSWPPGAQAPPGQSWPPAQPASGRPPTPGSGRKRGLIAAGTAAGLVVIFFIVAAVAGVAPFSKAHRPPVTPSPTPSPVKTTHAPPSTTPPHLTAGVTPLSQLLPGDIADPTTQCSAIKKPGWSSPGLVTALSCDDKYLPNGAVSGYQMDNRADFNKAWSNFNSWSSFDETKAGPNCPAPSSAGQGLTSWNSKSFPSMQGQVLECWTGSSAAPIYVWTMPSQDAFFIAVGADGSSFKALDSWWANYSAPANPPTATPSPQSP
jgi:hypothetical protein